MNKKIIGTLTLLASLALAACGTTNAQNPTPESEAPVEEIQPLPETIEETELTREEAIQIAEAHLASIGVENARLEYAELDTENGRRVWDIEFELGERDFEFYIDLFTGEFLKAPEYTPSATPSTNSRPATGEVSRDEAADIAMALVPNGTLIEVDRDTERSRNVWYVAIREGGTTHEIYVAMDNGEIVLHETY